MSRRGCLIIATVHLLGSLLVFVVLAFAAGRLLAVSDRLSQAEAIVVVGGEGRGFSRTRHALGLYRRGYAPVVVFSGGTLRDTGLSCSFARLSLEAARQLERPAKAAFIVDEAQSTYDEAVNLGRLARADGQHSLIVVTDPVHARRAHNTFRALLPGVTIQPSSTPSPGCDPGRWWQTEDGLVAVFSEMLKLCFYWA